jgi:hypothetical protein
MQTNGFNELNERNDIEMKKTQDAGKGSANRIKVDAQRVKKGGER